MTPGFRSARSIFTALSDGEKKTVQKVLQAPSSSPNDLVKALLNPESIAHGVAHASADALTALKTWVLESGQWRNVPRRGRIESGIQELAPLGWVFETYFGTHRRLPMMPWDLMPYLVHSLWEVPYPQLIEAASERQVLPAALWSPTLHDFFQLLSYAREETLLLTAQREVYRRQKNKLEKLLWPNLHRYPDQRVDYVLFTLDQMGFFEVKDDPFSYQISPFATQFMQKAPAEVFEAFLEFIAEPARMAWPGLLWISLVQQIPSDATLNITRAMEWMTKIGVSQASNHYLLNQAVHDLVSIGIFEVTGKETGRLTPWAYAAMHGQFEDPEPRSALAQPTGDILVPPTVPLSERWAIDGLATRVKSERVATYRLDQASVKRGLQRQLTAPQHAQLLDSLLRSPLPDNLRVNLQDWYRQFGRHRIMEVTLVHSLNANDSRDVQTLLGSDAVERLSDQDVVIPAHRVKDVLKKLERGGSPVLPEVLRPSHPAKEPKTLIGGQGPAPWPVRLPTEPSDTTLSLDELKKMISQAARQSKPVNLTYQLAGESLTRHEMVYPVTLDSQWVQVYVMSQRRYILVDWQQIFAAEEPQDL